MKLLGLITPTLLFLTLVTGQVAPGTVRVRLLDARGELTGVTNMEKVVKTDAEWQKQLTLEQYEVARGGGTERYANFQVSCTNLPHTVVKLQIENQE